MSSIAQKLCYEICDKSSLKLSKQNIRESDKKPHQASSSRYAGRPTRSVTIEKRRVVNKVIPSGIGSKIKIINKLKSKETLLNKEFVDTGLNTVITGPLRCDNYCITMVRKRDPKYHCKCAIKGINNKISAKEIQTFDNRSLYSDKACTHCIETVNCGTQFFERMNKSKSLLNKASKFKLQNDKNTQTIRVTNDISNTTDTNADKLNTNNYMGARRWALSNYPTRGPDF